MDDRSTVESLDCDKWLQLFNEKIVASIRRDEAEIRCSLGSVVPIHNSSNRKLIEQTRRRERRKKEKKRRRRLLKKKRKEDREAHAAVLETWLNSTSQIALDNQGKRDRGRDSKGLAGRARRDMNHTHSQYQKTNLTLAITRLVALHSHRQRLQQQNAILLLSELMNEASRMVWEGSSTKEQERKERERLMETRWGWDQYISNHGSRIPSQYLRPRKPSSDAWALSLTKNVTRNDPFLSRWESSKAASFTTIT